MGLFELMRKASKDSMMMARAKEAEKSLAAREKEFNERSEEYKEQGILFCPKCLARNIKTNKKKYKISINEDGPILTKANGEVIGSIFEKDIELVCPCCGYQWKPKK